MGARVMLIETVDDPESSSYKQNIKNRMQSIFHSLTHLLLLGYYGRLYPISDAIFLRHPIDNCLDALLWERVQQFIFLLEITVEGVKRWIQFVWLVF